MEVNRIQSFSATINGVEFSNERRFDVVEYILHLIEYEFGIEVTAQFVEDLNELVGDLRLASHAEENNATAIVLNGPVTVDTAKMVREYVDIPVIYTVIDKTRDLQPYIDAGVNIFNVSGGEDTVELVKWVREQYPDFPIIASGGKSDESIEATIDAGANAITYTAYGMMEQYFHRKMETYRQ